mgnify:FL=1|tara:strand:+ start:307 stop:549 length:243 start_codon:yes stop_codon:yes gene_type:complete
MSDNEIQRGLIAKEILQNDIFVESINKIRSELMNEWINSDTQNSEQREDIWKMRKMLEVVVNELQTVLETGKLATKNNQS